MDPSAIKEIAAGVFVIRDRRVPLVPNIGIILGSNAALVVDTGMGPANGSKVLEAARRIAGQRPLVLTLTHFHPEHGFGAQAFKGAAKILYNRSQRDELQAKGEAYLGMFRTFGPDVAQALEGTELVLPDEVYDGGFDGDRPRRPHGRTAHLGTGAHARRPDRLASAGAHRLHRRPRRGAHLPDLSVVPAERRRHRCRALGADPVGAHRWNPAIVVPGHGDIGGAEILAAVRDYMVDLGRRVAAERKAGKDADEIVGELAPKIRAEHPDWSAPEWIDFAIRYYSTRATTDRPNGQAISRPPAMPFGRKRMMSEHDEREDGVAEARPARRGRSSRR